MFTQSHTYSVTYVRCIETRSLTHLFGEQVDVLLVSPLGGVVELDESQSLKQRSVHSAVWFTGSLMLPAIEASTPSDTPSTKKNFNLLLWPCGFCSTCKVTIWAVCRSVASADLMTTRRCSLTLTASSDLLRKLAGASNGKLANHCKLYFGVFISIYNQTHLVYCGCK